MLIDVPFIDALDWFLPFYLDRQTDAAVCVCASVCVPVVSSICAYTHNSYDFYYTYR